MITAIAVIIIALVVLIVFLYVRQGKHKRTGYPPYIEALIALLEEDDATALKKLKETVSRDSDLIDAYIRLGALYRKQGDVPRATQIHQSLTVRPALNMREEKRVFYALVDDMLAANRKNKAISLLREILKIDKKDAHARELILKLYEEMGNYADCIAIYEEGRFKRKNAQRRAFYYASLAQSKLESASETDAQKEKEALNLLKKALKISSDSLSALYYLAAYHEQKGNLKKAMEHYRRIVMEHPDHAYLIIPAFERIHFELGSFDDIIPVYERVFRQHPNNFPVGVALAALYEKKNTADMARKVYAKLSQEYPENVLISLRLLKSDIDDSKIQERINEIENKLMRTEFRCSNCGFDIDRKVFLCPQCHAIESFLPRL
jgi:lipopolysaccharide biosynthesis regulator YciM